MKTHLIFPLFLFVVVVFLPKNDSQCHAKPMKADIDVQIIARAVELFHKDQNRYLTQAEGLQSLANESWQTDVAGQHRYLARIPHDPWGKPYHYRFPGIHNPDGFDIWTYGSDGIEGGEGMSRDCGNWEAVDCSYKDTRSFFERYFWPFLFFLVSPVLWLPLYIVHTIRRILQSKKVLTSFVGKHLVNLLLSFAVTMAFLAMPRVIGCCF